MNILAIDTETTQNCPEGFAANPYHADNRVVVAGWRWGKDVVQHWGTTPTIHLPTLQPKYWQVALHNAKFDLAYIFKHEWKFTDGFTTQSAQEFFDNQHLWDTAYAHYLLRGMAHTTYPKLDAIAPMYGGTRKVGGVGEAFDAGVGADKLDPELLAKYLDGDVNNTYIIAERQLQKDRQMQEALRWLMRFEYVLFQMEYNGMKLDRGVLLSTKEQMEEARLKLHHELVEILPDVPLNLDSTKHIQALAFGGVIKWEEREVVGVFKSGAKKGQPRNKVHKHEKLVNVFNVTAREEWATKTGVSVGDDTVQELSQTIPWFAKLSDYRRLQKEISTYYEGLETALYPDGYIHTNLNNVSTKTGRLSSTNPNLQNIPRDGDVKKCFASRWGDDGLLIQADFSQIEVVVQAWLTGDRKFIDDVLAGVDFHVKRLAWASEALLGETFTYEELISVLANPNSNLYGAVKAARTKAKGVTFARAYGAGARTISKNTGIPIDVVKQMIAGELEEYPGTEAFYTDLQRDIEQRLVHATHTAVFKDKADVEFMRKSAPTGYWRSPAGTIIGFPYYQKFHTEQLSLSPTKVRNYPVQHFAFLILAFSTVALYAEVRKMGGVAKIVNTVHDSIIIDCQKKHLDTVCKVVHSALTKAPQILKKHFNVDFTLPVGVDLEYGPNWKDMTKWQS